MRKLCYEQGRASEVIQKASDRALQSLELTLTNRMKDIERFVNWPALEQSLARDIEAIWQEQKRRKIERAQKK